MHKSRPHNQLRKRGGYQDDQSTRRSSRSSRVPPLWCAAKPSLSVIAWPITYGATALAERPEACVRRRRGAELHSKSAVTGIALLVCRRHCNQIRDAAALLLDLWCSFVVLIGFVMQPGGPKRIRDLLLS
jgi:hypothetical protein